jgi:fumarylacetoacetate (FAA) hydrolase
LISSGTVSNTDRSSGSYCLAEVRMLEILNKGEAKTPFLEFGDEARITMQDETGRNIFGDICQKLQQYQSSQS